NKNAAATIIGAHAAMLRARIHRDGIMPPNCSFDLRQATAPGERHSARGHIPRTFFTCHSEPVPMHWIGTV
ncbi:MAG: hypothetical protein WBE86_00445, partial [Candidatus Acidiferrales bacterium]